MAVSVSGWIQSEAQVAGFPLRVWKFPALYPPYFGHEVHACISCAFRSAARAGTSVLTAQQEQRRGRVAAGALSTITGDIVFRSYGTVW